MDSQSACLLIFPLQFTLETIASFKVPEYTGALFRGGFGQFFRDLVCVTRQPACGGCPHLATCPYSLVFETPVLPEKFAVLRKYPNAPHPFVMTPLLPRQTWLSAHQPLPLEITLIGHGVNYLPHFIHVFEKMGASGRYGGKFQIRQVVSPVTGEVVYDGSTRRILSQPAAISNLTHGLAHGRGNGVSDGSTNDGSNNNDMPGPECAQRLQLEFLTPLRLRTEGRYNSAPSFVDIARALLRRIHLLTELYGQGEGTTEWMHPLLACADRAIAEQSHFEMFRWDRMSGRQHRRVQMDGVLGKLTVSGDLKALAPWLRFGEWLHVGSGTSMGMGKYRVQNENDPKMDESR